MFVAKRKSVGKLDVICATFEAISFGSFSGTNRNCPDTLHSYIVGSDTRMSIDCLLGQRLRGKPLDGAKDGTGVEAFLKGLSWMAITISPAIAGNIDTP